MTEEATNVKQIFTPYCSSRLAKTRAYEKLVRKAIKKETPESCQPSPKRSRHSMDVEDKKITKCQACAQSLSEVQFYNEHPPDSVNEKEAVAWLLQNYSGATKHFNILNYVFHCENGHICSLDSGHLEKGVKIYFSGYLKIVDDETFGCEGGVSVRQGGPIDEWFVINLDEPEGIAACLGVITYGSNEVFLKHPHPSYESFEVGLQQRVFMAKTVLDCLGDEAVIDYDDFIAVLAEKMLPYNGGPLTERDLMENLPFILEQVEDQCGQSQMVASRCKECSWLKYIQSFVQNPFLNNNIATTGIVFNVFNPIFGGCIRNLDMSKAFTVKVYPRQLQKVQCYGFLGLKGNRQIFIEVVGAINYRSGEFVQVASRMKSNRYIFARIVYVWRNCANPNNVYLHVQVFIPAEETVLGSVASPNELFQTEKCVDIEMCSVVKKQPVTYMPAPANWSQQGVLGVPSRYPKDATHFFFCRRYNNETATFTTPVDMNVGTLHICGEVTTDADNEKPGLCVGDHIFLHPYLFDSKQGAAKKKTKKQKYNITYPNKHLKTMYRGHGSNDDTSDPFIIARITEIGAPNCTHAESVELKVQVYLRPHQVTECASKLVDEHQVYQTLGSPELITLDEVEGRCEVKFFKEITEARDWCNRGPSRFFYTNAVEKNAHNEQYRFVRASINQEQGDKEQMSYATLIKLKLQPHITEVPQEWPVLKKKLRCMDLFAGCGGFSLGIEQSGLAEVLWAVEADTAAAQSYKLNHLPNCSVFVTDINVFINQAMKGKDKICNGLRIPEPGEVDLIIGGPPCQGFSTMNIHSETENSIKKSALVVSFLTCCDFYRPRWIVMENVSNMFRQNDSLVFRYVLKALLAMEYQVGFTLLQAGNFGVPQARSRGFIIAAAPGEKLPNFPWPTHTFNPIGTCRLNIGEYPIESYHDWGSNAPFKTVTVKDAIGDLPQECITGNQRLNYSHPPASHFQRESRTQSSFVTDHKCLKLGSLNQARVDNLPIEPLADWRDLPNIVVPLPNGKFTHILKYQKYKNEEGENFLGVCPCVVCPETYDRAICKKNSQVATLIPWAFAHLAHRKNFSSSIGRLDYKGYFATLTTVPNITGYQGRYVHPTQPRVLSVREYMRAQSFPDHIHLFGSVEDKYRQVGNAVPPLLAEALGREMLKVVAQ